MPKTRDFSKVIEKQLADNSRLRDVVEKERLNAAVATLIYDARTEAGLTQKQLAELVGTQQSVIARLEDADYGGHSLNLLERIAAALGRQLQVSFGPALKRKAAAGR
jgi:ribosome-binding protein aMBF1 (putative translation factor)